MERVSGKILMAISAVANHGKTSTGKQLIRRLVADKAFNELCPNHLVWKLGLRMNLVRDLSEDDKGDWVAYFFDAAKGEKPVVAVVTGGDGWTPEVQKVYEKIFSFDTVKVVVGACRPNNNVHDNLMRKAKEHTFSMVETSPVFVSLNTTGKTGKEVTKMWNDRGACRLMETLKEALHLTDLLKLKALHQMMKEEQANGRLAFLLGNGINKYATDGKCPSWDDLIKELWNDISTKHKYQTADEGYALTEQFDILRNHQNKDATDADITKRVQEMVRRYYTGNEDYYAFLRKRLESISTPVLTTNFDANLEGDFSRRVISVNGSNNKDGLISDIYHWNEYYANEPIAVGDMGRKFSVWHLHGNVNQKKTIRLDLSAYMGQVTYTRNFLQDKARLWAVEKEDDPWGMEGRNSRETAEGYAFTWLHIFYNSAICINGLRLSTDETYLRWLLISRYKYQKRIGIKPKGWYIHGHRDTVTNGMKSFLRGVGIEPLYIESDEARYRDLFDF